jgi:hypothetical protein
MSWQTRHVWDAQIQGGAHTLPAPVDKVSLLALVPPVSDRTGLTHEGLLPSLERLDEPGFHR